MTPSYIEDHISQLPALQMLIKMGYTYISPEEALQLREGRKTNVLLRDIHKLFTCLYYLNFEIDKIYFQYFSEVKVDCFFSFNFKYFQ